MSETPVGDHVQMPGGTGAEKPADDKIRGVIEKLRGDIKLKIEELHGKELKNVEGGPLFEVLSYKSQVVAGSNYFIKVRVLGDENESTIWHIRVYEHWSGNPLEVSKVKVAELDHPLTHFD